MPKLHSQDIDPLNTPMEIAENLYRDQLDAAIDIIAPKKHLAPSTQFLHDQGLTVKQLREMRDGIT